MEVYAKTPFRFWPFFPAGWHVSRRKTLLDFSISRREWDT